MTSQPSGGLPPAVREAIRKSLRNHRPDESVAVSEIAAAVRNSAAAAHIDPDELEDAIAQEATLAQLAVEFDENARRR
ncbi:MAG: hypothetical protein K5872_08705 [Rhizobiaceae bacterium]|nr:hypothetical protein [Rhizobiaceae bacterium]MCV0406294.1 hypothetical protein [Rhizobiaceae bacterium]